MNLLVRPFVASDTARLRAICHQTVNERPFLPFLEEPRFASALYLDPFLQIESESCFVAELEHEIVGYLVGTRNVGRFQRQLDMHLRRQLPALLWIHLEGAVRGRLRHVLSHRILAETYLRVIFAISQETSITGRYLDLDRYPAHCHLQVSPAARGKRAGLALMLRFHQYLRTHRVSGQYSTVVEEVGRESYSRMMLAMHFRLVHESTFTRRERPALIHAGTWRDRILACDF